jgi:hypothetical protein
MKTTIEIADSLLDEAREIAAEDKTTLRALVDRGLRREIDERRSRKRRPFKMLTVKGKGLRPEFADADWARIRDAIYEGRGA